MPQEIWKIVLAGEGGQGIQTIALILAEAAYHEGQQVLYIPNFGVEQRGGVSLAFCQIGQEKVGSPKFRDADVAVALSRRAIQRTKPYLREDTLLIFDRSVVADNQVLPPNVLSIPALEIAQKELHPRVFNIVIMGALWAVTQIVSEKQIKKMIENKFAAKFAKDPQLRELNLQALQRGVACVADKGAMGGNREGGA